MTPFYKDPWFWWSVCVWFMGWATGWFWRAHHEWLKRTRAKVGANGLYGKFGEPYRDFYWRRKQHA